MIKNFLKKITGIKAIEDAKVQAQAEADVAIKLAAQKLQEAVEAEIKAEEAKLSPKERATKRNEPWVGVLETHVNRENPANGFFELDWNEEFVVQLRQAGYGYEGDPDELVVDLWFKTLCRNVLSEEGLPMDNNRTQGFINVQKIDANRSEIG
jgi:hypothetical protein